MLKTKKDSNLKRTKIRLLLLFVGMNIFYNCTYELNVDRFAYYKKPIIGKIPLRLDGYYYTMILPIVLGLIKG